MVTLTYAAADSWEPEHVSALLKRIDSWARRRGLPKLPYVWVLELTKTKRVHYHLLIWLPRGTTLPKPDKQGWWAHGLTRIEWAKKAVGYIAKYTSKGLDDPRDIPKGARISGRGGLPKGSPELMEARWWRWPQWLRDRFTLADGIACRRLTRLTRPPREDGGRPFAWITSTGELIASPWRSFFCTVRRCVIAWRA